jgi:hypothetical protein
MLSRKSFWRNLIMHQLFRIANFLGAAVALLSTSAYAQSSPVLERPPALERVQVDVGVRSAKAGPVIYVTDKAGELSTVTLGTYAVHRIGAEGVLLTDIGFDPKDGELYGVSFTSFYRVNRTTGQAVYIGNLGISDANALVFDAAGRAYTAGVNDPELYAIDVTTGAASPVGSTAPFDSAGDLTFYNGGLVLAGFVPPSHLDELVLLDPPTGKPKAAVQLNITNLFALASTGPNTLYGFAGTDLYALYPGESNIYKRSVLLKTFAGTGLAQIYGCAYDGYFQN